jgi:hypothetical protein
MWITLCWQQNAQEANRGIQNGLLIKPTSTHCYSNTQTKHPAAAAVCLAVCTNPSKLEGGQA